MYNLVQAEFSHVGRIQDWDISDILRVTRERISEIKSFVTTGVKPSSRIKTVVRFFDVEGILTTSALESERLRKLHNNLVEDFEVASPPGRVILGGWSKRLAGGILAHQNICKLHAQAMLRQAVTLSFPIGVENSNHTFRLAQEDELHEILEAALGSSSVWLFVFTPNSLLSDENKLIASAM